MANQRGYKNRKLLPFSISADADGSVSAASIIQISSDTWRTLRRLDAFCDEGAHGSWGPPTTVGMAFARHTLTQPAKP